MLFSLRLAAFLAFANTAFAATGAILFPLYFEPVPTTCWPELQNASIANPTIPFILIINPDSGPGTDLSDAQLACIPSIRASMPSATIVGYVPTGYGNRSAALVQKDIATYQSWKTVQQGGKDIPLDGVFLDEIPDDDTNAHFELYGNYSAAIKAAFGSAGDGFVILNPGTAISSRFYNIANLIVTFEDQYSDWDQTLISTDITTPLDKQAIMIYDFPPKSAVNSTADMDAVITPFAPDLGAIYITDRIIATEDMYGDFGDDWDQFVAEVAKYED